MKRPDPKRKRRTRWDAMDKTTHIFMVRWLKAGCPDPKCRAKTNEPHIEDCTFCKWAMEEAPVDG